MVTIKVSTDLKYRIYEKQEWSKGNLVCGIDEVGRGCFAGPVVAAAVMLKPNAKHQYLKDSKVLTEDQRLKAYKWIIKNSHYSVGIINHRIIDNINIYHATLKAMKRALVQLLACCNKGPSVILVDFMPLKLDNTDIPIYHFAKGESKSPSIAAASIVAKVSRDKIMQRLDSYLPGYSLFTNKGYGTGFHKKSLKQNGALFIHRTSFINNIIY